MKRLLHVIVAVMVMLAAGCGGYAGPEKKKATRYATYPSWEVDRLASIWLIKKYVDKEAEFVFIKEGDSVEGLVQFDTPDAELQRKHNQACFQIILQKYELSDPKLKKLATLVWDIEINFWGEKKFPESKGLKDKIDSLIALKLTPQETVKKSFEIFDAMMQGT